MAHQWESRFSDDDLLSALRWEELGFSRTEIAKRLSTRKGTQITRDAVHGRIRRIWTDYQKSLHGVPV